MKEPPSTAWLAILGAILLAFLGVLAGVVLKHDDRIRRLEAVTHDHRYTDGRPRYPPHWQPR